MKYGRQPQKIWKFKMTSKKLKMEKYLKMFEIKDEIKKFENGRWLQKICKCETAPKKLKMDDGLKRFENGRQP